MPRSIPADSFAAKKLRARFEDEVASDDLDLPLLPDSAGQVLAACNSEECDARALATLINRDPALASHVLRVANSAAYAPQEPIVSLQQAVSRLGIGTLCGIAISVVAQSEVFALPGHTARMAALWRHSAVTAAWSRQIARMRRRNVEGAFLAGLLHDIGKPIVLEALSGLEKLAGIRLAPELFDEWLDEFHPAVGARLLTAWNLPSWVSEAAGHHHHPAGAAAHEDEVRTVCLANQLAHATDGGDENSLDELRGHEAIGCLGIYVDELDELLEHTEDVLDLARVFL